MAFTAEVKVQDFPVSCPMGGVITILKSCCHNTATFTSEQGRQQEAWQGSHSP